MPTLSALQHRLAQLAEQKNEPLTLAIIEQLKQQSYQGALSAPLVQQFCQQFSLSKIELGLACVPIAACYALTPVSHFYVGAVAIGLSGSFYFGANQEFAGIAMQQTVHAEQSAISHAWLACEGAISDMVVNCTPCGHCRQFMNELNTATTLQIHLPHRQHNTLQQYLIDAFGPKDLNIANVLFDQQHIALPLQGDALVQAAIKEAQQAYAPYSQAVSAAALQVGEQIVCGRYAENAAFNPSLLPLQSALNYRRFLGLSDVAVSRVVMVEKRAELSHYHMSKALAETALGLTLEYIAV
ncbi:cytidine deaminase [[Haemophilus] ducreyi]|uniref:cytidine deaminase n=1 Tax=Haemophilus ducreyi TaxID=730 RepID=UPI0006565088|nr:cytidine deaminase [[Haemophilus] ducreyi]AKO45322.1 cytidine deaminase [[Haemophilus] ducreyi]AKO46707.1 cytidine deaminase [[Haemophilus] ducreyi]AKO48048.1 cytidine deaminase [[Haemophilus] ducreyi]AKO49435.1 cytidine deaminase [[Haemophilus] ducreyi]ANF67777.1 cytidine deaminase [[Haemophilus] ducreyi]